MLWIDLSENPLGDDGIEAVASWLKVHLAQPLVEATRRTLCVLQDCRTIERLDLRLTNVGHSGVASLTKALLRNFSLRQLNLSSNDIHPTAVDTLALAIEAHPRLAVSVSLTFAFLSRC